jgi:hypothetical protein
MLLLSACDSSVEIPSDYSQTTQTVTIEADIGVLDKAATSVSIDTPIRYSASPSGLDVFHIRQPANQNLSLDIVNLDLAEEKEHSIYINVFDSDYIDVRSKRNIESSGRVNTKNRQISSISLMGAIQIPADSQATEIGLMVSDEIFVRKGTDDDEQAIYQKNGSSLYFPSQNRAADYYITVSLGGESDVNDAELELTLSEEPVTLIPDYQVSTQGIVDDSYLDITFSGEPILIEVENITDFQLAALVYNAYIWPYDDSLNELVLEDVVDIAIYESLSGNIIKKTQASIVDADTVANIVAGKSKAFYLQITPKVNFDFGAEILISMDGETYDSEEMEFFSVEDLLYDEISYLLVNPNEDEYQIDIYSPWFVDNNQLYNSVLTVKGEQSSILETNISTLPFSATFNVDANNNGLPLLLSIDGSQAFLDFGSPESRGLEGWPNFYWGIKPKSPKLMLVNEEENVFNDGELELYQLPNEKIQAIEFVISSQDDAVSFELEFDAQAILHISPEIESTEDSEANIDGSVSYVVKDQEGVILLEASIDISESSHEFYFERGIDFESDDRYFLEVFFVPADDSIDNVFIYSISATSESFE